MKKFIQLVTALLLTFVNGFAENNGNTSLPPVAGFSASVTSGCTPLAVTFTSTSTSAGDPITNYHWDFGDGNTASTTNPNVSHTYTAEGHFTVSLTVTTQSSAINTHTATDYITTDEVGPITFAGMDTIRVCGDWGFGYELSLGNGDTYSWNDPSWNGFPMLYAADPGTYWGEVTKGVCTLRDTVTLVATPFVDIQYTPVETSNCGGVVKIRFNNHSTFNCGTPATVQYYAEALTSSETDMSGSENPEFTFTSEGTHTVRLQIRDDDNYLSESRNFTVNVAFASTAPPTAPALGGDKTICPGGSVQLDAGNEPGVTYSWSPATGLSNPNIYNPIASPSSTQTYTVTKSKCGMDVTGSVTVYTTGSLTVNLGPDLNMCPGNVFLLNTNVSGATSITWGSNPANSAFSTSYQNAPQASVMEPATYWVTVVKDGCTARDTIVIAGNKGVKADFIYAQNTSCPPYDIKFTADTYSTFTCGSRRDFSWNFGDGSPVVNYAHPAGTLQRNPLHTYAAAGTYNVTLIVTNSNNRADTITLPVTVTAGSVPVVNLGTDASICSGGNITLDAGNAGATYLWSTGATTQTINVNAAGSYSVAVNNGSCTARDTINVAVGATITVDLGPDQTICTGGSITLDAGNHPGATYSWNTGATTRTITVSASGNYIVTVNNGTCSASDSKNITIGTAPVVDLGADQTICAGGSVTLDAGSHPGSTYSWSNGATTQTITVSAAGTYTVTVDNGTCSTSDSKTITMGTTPVVDLGADQTICAGGNITLDAGSHPGSTYSWSTGATTQTITVSAAGTYTVTVNNGTCSASDSKTITMGTTPVVDLGPDQTICAGGNITLDAGSHPGATYSWSNGATTQTITVSAAGTYTVTVNNGTCSASDSKTITMGITPVVDLGADQTICASGSIILDAGNHPGATYSWNTGATSRTISVSTSGTYIVTVNNGMCSASDSKTITMGTVPVVNLGADQTICAGGTITLDAGSQPGATYSWSNGATTQTITVNAAGTYTVTVDNGTCSASDSKTITMGTTPVVDLGADQTICTGGTITLDAGSHPGATYSWSTGATTQTITVSAAGTYTVTVDNGTCSASDSKTITMGTTPVVDLGADQTICAGGTITLDAGSHPGATYSWSTGATTQTITVSAAGNYTVTVDNGTCSASDSKTITLGATPTVNLGPDQTICAGNNVTLDAGSISGATYLWSNSATTQTISVNAAGSYWVEVSNGTCSVRDTISVSVGAATAVNLGPDLSMCPGNVLQLNTNVSGATSITWGSNPANPAFTTSYQNAPLALVMQPATYWVTVVKNGCTATDTVVVSASKGVKAGFTYSQSSQCIPYKVKFVSDALSPITCGTRKSISWDFGDGTPVTTINSPGSALRNPEHNYMTSGTFTVRLIVTNSSNISDTATIPVIVTGSGLTVNLGNDTAICAGTTITLDAGNIPGATYKWDHGPTSQTVTVGAGTYRVEITNGSCTVDDVIIITEAANIPVNLGNDTTICAGSSITLDAGNPGASYLWSNGATTQTITVTPTQSGEITVAVNNGTCTGNGVIRVTVVSGLPVNLGNDTTICAGNTVTLDAGYPGAIYTWNNSAVTQTINVGAGTYSVQVNRNGCIGTDEIAIDEVNPPTAINLGNDTTVCFGNGLLLDAGNHPGASYLWSTGATTQTINVTATGNYSVDVTGCSVTLSDAIHVSLSTAPLPSITQNGLELVASAASTYQWYKGGIIIPNATAQRLKARGYGLYSVVVTIAGVGCEGEASYFFVPNGEYYLGDIRVKATPNPGNGVAKLILSKVPSKPVKVTVYDRVGKRILVNTVINSVNDLNLTSFAKGEYFVELVLDDKRIVIPVITQ